MADRITLTSDPATALTCWEAAPDDAIYTDGAQWIVGPLAILQHLRDGWRLTCPEALEAQAREA